MTSSRVTMFYVPSDGISWATYIGQILSSNEYSIQCELCDFTAEPKLDLSTSKVNVFFITPDFLEHSNWQILHAVDKRSCILVLTGIDHAELDVVLSRKCDHIEDYYIHEMVENDKSVRDLLIFIISKFEEDDSMDSVSHSNRSSGHRQLSGSYSVPTNYKYHEEEGPKDYYDKLPVPRQVNFLQDILYQDKKLYIVLARRPEGKVTVKIQDNEFSPRLEDYGVYKIPYERNEATEVKVLQDGKVLGQKIVEIELLEESASQTPASPDVLHFKTFTRPVLQSVYIQTESANSSVTPRPLSDSDSDSIYVNHDTVEGTLHTKGKLDRIRELLEEETDPEQILCQCLGIERDITPLDEKMTSLVQQISALRPPSTTSHQESTEDESVWPTLVHFGAEYNLRKFCEALLSNPLLRGACLIPNKDGNLPHDIARLKGHHELSDMLKSLSEQERDSGISGTSRSSEVSTLVGPPSPHLSGWGEYIDTGKECPELSEEEEHAFEKGHHRNSSTSTDKTMTPPFKEMLKMQEVLSGSEGGTPTTTDDESDLERVHHKNVYKLLGMKDEDSCSLGGSKKQDGKLKKLFMKNQRSQSEPFVCPEDITIVRKKTTKSYFRGKRNSRSSRSSGSSTTSTISDELSEVTLRSKGITAFGKRLTKRFLDSAKKRKSARIERAMGDSHGGLPGLPALPSRLTYDINEKF